MLKNVKKQLGTALRAKLAPIYASIFMNELESDFLKSQELTPVRWYRYIEDVFLSGLTVNKNLHHF